MTSPGFAAGASGNRRRQSSWWPPIAAIHSGWASAIAGLRATSIHGHSVIPARSTASAIGFHRRFAASSSGTTTALTPLAFHAARNPGETRSIPTSTPRIGGFGSAAWDSSHGTSTRAAKTVSKTTRRDMVFLELRCIFRLCSVPILRIAADYRRNSANWESVRTDASGVCPASIILVFGILLAAGKYRRSGGEPA